MKNTVRVTSGIYRGRVLLAPGGKTHPMGDREKLALFNIISEYLPGAVVLDAYAGSGALGIEALSRGAKDVVFIEKNKEAARCIRDNLAKIGLDNVVVDTAVVNYTNNDNVFDVILADPPYDDFREDEILYLIQFLSKNGVLALSHPGNAPELTGMVLKTSKKYAGATISIFVKE